MCLKGGLVMCEYLSIKDGRTEEIQLIKFKKQCPTCRNAICNFGDSEMNLFIVTCGFCTKKYRIPIDDYHNVMRLVEYEV